MALTEGLILEGGRLRRLPLYLRRQIPEGLATRPKLRAEGLNPGGDPVGIWRYFNDYGWQLAALYERAAAVPRRRCSPRQLEALAKARQALHDKIRRCPICKVIVAWPLRGKRCPSCRDDLRRELVAEARAEACRWALELFTDPRAVVIDYETTGLFRRGGRPRAVEVSIRSMGGRVLLETLINPEMPIPTDATWIHGITDAMVADAPTVGEVMPRIAAILAGRRAVAFNADFEAAITRVEMARAGLGEMAPPVIWECLMLGSAPWHGCLDGWDLESRRVWFRWPKLNGSHRAGGDCRAKLALLEKMAAEAVGGDDDEQQAEHARGDEGLHRDEVGAGE